VPALIPAAARSIWPAPETGNAGSRRSAALRVAEPQADPLTEADLAAIWEGQRYPPGSLLHADGSAVEVLHPGRRGRGSGPDFRDAAVRQDGREQRGDVELHVRASYFLQHGHQFDPAYDRLVLHVVFADDVGGLSPLPGGGRVPVASFAVWVNERAADIASWLRRPPLWHEPCHDATARLGIARVRSELGRGGSERFRARAEALAREAALEGPDEALWRALMEALGYGGDRAGFSRLARALPAAFLMQVLSRGVQGAVYATLASVAGLAAPLEGLSPLSPPLRRAGGRPANRPEARLRAAAALLAAGPQGLAARALTDVGEIERPSALVRRWQPPPLGTARATELLVNAVLPFVAGCAPETAGRCLEIAGRLRPNAPYGKTLFLERNLAPSPGKRAAASALEQQGLLELHASWCSRGGCGRCPLS
jgi:hypothetical protein